MRKNKRQAVQGGGNQDQCSSGEGECPPIGPDDDDIDMMSITNAKKSSSSNNNNNKLLGPKSKELVDRALHKYVIRESSSSSSSPDGDSSTSPEWHFRSWFVVEATTFNLLLALSMVFLWMINRQTHIQPTKGSKIRHKSGGGQGQGEDDDDDEIEDRADMGDDLLQESSASNLKRMSTRLQRKTILVKLAAYDTERDDEEEDDDDDDDDDELTPPSPSPQHTSSSSIPLTREKRALLKIVQQIKIFSYLNEDAMAMCLEHVEIVKNESNGSKELGLGHSIFDRGTYDGSLYAVLSGTVKCRFHSYTDVAGETGYGDNNNNNNDDDDVLSATFQKGDVVTSLLAMLAGMTSVLANDTTAGDNTRDDEVDATIPNELLFAKDISAVAVQDHTQVIRIPPICFAQVLQHYPADVYRIAQTVLNRAQRLTVQTLVQTLGLRKELVPRPPKTANSNNQIPGLNPLFFPWTSQFLQQAALHDWTVHNNDSNASNSNKNDEKLQVQRAAIVFCQTIGIPTDDKDTTSASTIQLLKEYSSFVTLQPGELLIAPGETHDACYLVLKGTMASGLSIPPKQEQNKDQTENDARDFQPIARISPGQLVGEYICFTGDVSLFHVECSKRNNNTVGNKNSLVGVREDAGCTLLKVPRHVYMHLIRRYPNAMARTLRGILQLISPEVHLLNWTSDWSHVEAAEEIVRRGAPCDGMYVVLNGRLRGAASSKLKKEEPDRYRQDLEYGRGKIVGEVGCLTGGTWNYNLYAIRNSEIVKVPMRTLLAIIGTFPTAGLHLARSIADKVAQNHYHFNPVTVLSSATTSTKLKTDIPIGRRSNIQTPGFRSISGGAANDPSSQSIMPSYGLRLATIAVVPLTDSINMDLFCSSLVTAFGQIAPCKLLTKQTVREELGEKVYRTRNAMHDLRLTRLFADTEENNRLVVYQADQKYTWWTRLCVQQADCILLVVNADRAPDLKRVEQSLEWAHQSINVRIDLVVVGNQHPEEEEGEDEVIDYEADDEISVSDQLNNWSEQRKWVAGHHLVRKPFRRFPLDFHRMCRRVSGRAVGLVLGGGGARGLAHIGVIRALKEAGITVDMVGGTSQGAFVGALYARQPDDFDSVVESCRKMAKSMSSVKNKVFDVTLPMTSMFCGRLFNRCIRKLLGKIRIQDLVLNFFCVSVDLQKQTQVVHTKGVLWKYVRASMSLTGYLPPVAENGSLLVDGGYLNAVPADVMRQQMGARTVIAVDVSPESERDYFDYGMTLSGWWLLWNSLNPFVKTVQVPSMGDISDLLIWVSSEQHRRNVKMCSDLHLTPPVQDIGTLEYHKFDEIVEMSYLHAKPLVDEFCRQNPWLVG